MDGERDPWAQEDAIGAAPKTRPGQSAFEMAESLSSWKSNLVDMFGGQGEAARWEQGAHGELTAGRWLRKLERHGWMTAHDLGFSTGNANVDHVTIGPGGIFSINTKKLSHRVRVTPSAIHSGKYKTDYLRKSRTEAVRVYKELQNYGLERVWVTPLLLIISPDEPAIKGMPKDVDVVFGRRVIRHLRDKPETLSYQDQLNAKAALSNWLRGKAA